MGAGRPASACSASRPDARRCVRRALAAALAAAVLAIAGVVPAPAAEATPPVRTPGGSEGCPSPERCFARMVAAQRDVATIRARFVQTKRVALLEEPLVSEGRFSFSRPDSVRWEMESPEPLVVEVRGTALRAGPPGEVADVEAGPAVLLFRELAAIFTGAKAGGSRFAVGPVDGAAATDRFRLTPLDPSVSRIIAAIDIELDPESGGPRRMVIRESGGDQTEIVLSDVQVERRDGAGSPP